MLLGQALLLGKDGKVRDCAILLYRGLQKGSFTSFFISFRLTEVAQSILVEVGDEGSLVLVEDELCDKLANTLHIQKLDDIDFVSKLCRSRIVSFKSG